MIGHNHQCRSSDTTVSTNTTSASTISQSTANDNKEIEPYHNPMFLGNLDYYFPRRLQPMTNDIPRTLEQSYGTSIHIPELAQPHHFVLPNHEPNSQYTALSQDTSTSSTQSDNDLPTSTRRTNTTQFLAPIPITVAETISPIALLTVLPPSTIPTLNTELNVPIDPTPTTTFIQTTMDNSWDNFQPTSSNIRSNEEWGDSIEVKSSNSVRIYFKNVNSFGLSQGNTKINTILQSMQQVDCDIMNFVQTSINWRFLHLRNRLHIALKNIFPINKLNISRNKFVSHQPALPGGCAQIVKGDWSGRIVEYIHDFRNMGRWCGIKIRLKGERHLYLITAYRVFNQNSASIGPETAYR